MNDFIMENGVLKKYTGPGGNVKVPDGVKTVGVYAFHDRRNLISVTLPEGVEEILDCAFQHCRGLNSVTLPDSLKKIGYRAFFDCPALKKVFLGRNTEIPVTHFPSSCTVIVAPYLSLAGLKTPYAHALLLGFVQARENGSPVPGERTNEYLQYIRSHRKSLYPLALKEHALLKLMITEEIIRPEDTEALLSCAQEDLSAKTLLIGYQQKMFRPSDEQEEWEEALRPLHIQEEREKQEKARRAEEAGIVSAAAANRDWQYGRAEDGGIRILGYKGTDPHVTVPRVIGDRPVTAIGQLAFSPDSYRASDEIKRRRAGIETVQIPAGVTSIGDFAFSGCKKLSSVTLPDSVTHIGHSAFACCEVLPGITLPAALQSMEDNAFYGCRALRSVTVPGNTECIPCLAFYGCTALRELVLKNGVRGIAGLILDKCPGPVTVTVPRTVEQIDESAFSGAEDAVTLRVKLFSHAFRYALRHRLRFKIAGRDE